ncbi:substrate-binding domain-containing protein [candidate division KSB1 bacterium]
MKKIIFLFTGIILTLLLMVNCSGKKDSKKWVVGFSQCNSAEPWREAMNKSMMTEAAKHPEIELIISDGQQDNAKQVADVENFLVKEVDLLIISPNEAKPLTAVVGRVFNKGIPVVVLDRKIDSETFTTFIGADNLLIGREAGKFAALTLNGKGKIVELWGLKGSTPAQERHDGFAEGIKDYPEIEIIYAQDGAWLRRRGKEIMENALQSLEQIDLVYGHNDPMAIGAFIAAKNAGRENEMKFLGIDALPGPEGGCQAVIDGQLTATFLYPNCGKEAVEYALKILKGEEVPEYVTLKTAKIIADNAAEYVK